MRIANSVVTVRTDRNRPVHISEVIPDVLGGSHRVGRTVSTSDRSRLVGLDTTRLSESQTQPRVQRMEFPLGTFWVRTAK